ncbi:hypothetical protein MHYP_G00217120 [Metynnis hypsauchen]
MYLTDFVIDCLTCDIFKSDIAILFLSICLYRPSSQTVLPCLRQMSLSTRSQQHTVNTVTAQLPICTAV